MLIYQAIITAILAIMLLNTINNLRLFHQPGKRPKLLNGPLPAGSGPCGNGVPTFSPAARGPLVSVLVPARNEERSVARCVESLARQDYPNLEILVLDDQSEDRTAAIVEDLARRYPTVRLLRGGPLPPNWHGKAFACAQLARAARGAWLLFVDADTIHAPETVSTTLQYALHQQADLLTMIPQVLEESFGEALLLPWVLMPFVAFLPMGLVNGKKHPWLAGALGPFLLFRRETYQRIGGHEAVRADIAEDMKFSRLVKRHGGKLVWIDGTALVQIRFYQNFGEAWRGLAKSAFTTLNYSISALAVALVPCIAIFLAPYLFVAQGLLSRHYSVALFWLPLSQILLTWTFRLLIAQRFHMRRWVSFLHAVSILAAMLFTLQSVYQATFVGGIVWKGRAYRFRGQGEQPAPQQRLAQGLRMLRLGLASVLALLGWRWGSDALGVAALLALVIWTCAMLQQALASAPDSVSSATLANVADGASGAGALIYLLLSGLMTLWLLLLVLLALAASIYTFHWHSLPTASSITLGSLLLLIAGANFSLIRVVLFWWALGALVLARRPIGQFLGAWLHRLRPPL